MSTDSRSRRPFDRAEIQRIIAINREDMDNRAHSYRDRKYGPWHIPYWWREVGQVVSPLMRIEAPRILDVGCGVGLITQMVMKKVEGEVTAIDVSPKALELFMQTLPQSERGRVRTEEIDAEGFFQSSNETFHLLIFSAVLHHIPNYLDVLEMACAATAPGGVIFITREPVHHAERGRVGRWIQFVDGNVDMQNSLWKDSVAEWWRYNRRYLRKVLPKSSRWYRRIDEDVRGRDSLHNEAEYYSEIDRQAILQILRCADFDILVSDAARPAFNFHLSQILADKLAAKMNPLALAIKSQSGVNTLLTFKIIAQRRTRSGG